MYPDYELDYDYGYDILTDTNTLNIVEQLQEKVKDAIDAIFGIIMNVYNQGIAFAITMLILVLIAYIMIKIAKMFIFKKAKVSPWEALIPIHSQYKMFEIVGINRLWTFGCFSIFLLLFSKVGIILWLIYNFGIHVYTTIKLMKVFGKSKLFTAGGIVVPFVIYPIIAFGSSKYNGTYSGNTAVNSTIKIKNKNEIEDKNKALVEENKEQEIKENKENKENNKSVFGRLKKDKKKEEVRNPYMNGTKAQELKEARRIPTPMGANLQGYNQVFRQDQYQNNYMNNNNMASKQNMVQTAPPVNNQATIQNKERATMMNAYLSNLNQNMNMSMNNNNNQVVNQNMNQSINQNPNINNNNQRPMGNNNQINPQQQNKNIQNANVNVVNNNMQNKENNGNNNDKKENNNYNNNQNNNYNNMNANMYNNNNMNNI